jgi:hypothetical protein
MFIAIGKTAYAIRGGIQIEACEVFASGELGYMDMPPSDKAQLRNTDDTKPIYMSTMFGKTIDTKGLILPSNDINRKNTDYKIFNGSSIEAQEVDASTAMTVIQAAALNSVYLEQMSIIRKCLSVNDITINKVILLESKLSTIWNKLISATVFTGSLVSGGKTSVSSNASGIPIGSSASYDYNERYAFGTLKVKLVQP